VQIISRLFSGSEDRLIFSRDVNKDSALIQGQGQDQGLHLQGQGQDQGLVYF